MHLIGSVKSREVRAGPEISPPPPLYPIVIPTQEWGIPVGKDRPPLSTILGYDPVS